MYVFLASIGDGHISSDRLQSVRCGAERKASRRACRIRCVPARAPCASRRRAIPGAAPGRRVTAPTPGSRTASPRTASSDPPDVAEQRSFPGMLSTNALDKGAASIAPWPGQQGITSCFPFLGSPRTCRLMKPGTWRIQALNNRTGYRLIRAIDFSYYVDSI